MKREGIPEKVNHSHQHHAALPSSGPLNGRQFGTRLLWIIQGVIFLWMFCHSYGITAQENSPLKNLFGYDKAQEIDFRILSKATPPGPG